LYSGQATWWRTRAGARGGARAGDTKHAAEWIKSHDLCWGSEQAMDEGSPTRALERGEKTKLPPVIYSQGTVAPAHSKPNLVRFQAAWRKMGGRWKRTGSKA